MAPKVKTDYPQWFLDELDDSNDREALLNGCLKKSEKLHFKCSTCGMVYIQSIANHITPDNQPKQGCPNCAKIKRANTHKSTSSKKRLNYPQWFIDDLWYDEDKEKAKSGFLTTHSKVYFKCPICGKSYQQQITNHIKLSTQERKFGACPECSNNKKGIITPYPDWFIDELKNDEDKEKARKGILKVKEIVEFYCEKCNMVYKQKVCTHITKSTGEKKKGCPSCGIVKQKESSRKTKGIIKPYPQWFIDDLYLNEDKELAKITNFYGDEEKLFYCKEHDEIYKQKIQAHINVKTHERKKIGCLKCLSEKIKDTLSKQREYPEWFINELKNDEDKEKARKGLLLGSDKVEFVCFIHKKSYKQTVQSKINISTGEKKLGCPYCGRESFYKRLSDEREYPEWFIDDLYLEEDKDRARRGTLTTTDFVLFKCKYNHVYKSQVKNHIILSRNEPFKGCPFCFPNRSKKELEIEEFIKSLSLYTEHKKFKYKDGSLFEIDIFIPEKNIGIEYNGSFYHRTIPIYERSKDKLYHQNKYLECKQQGIRLISIFDVDWESHTDKIKQYLKDLLLPIENKIYARKCVVKQIDYKTANFMYEEYHLLGKTTVQAISYGLYYNNELISCMSFQKGRYKENKDPVWALTRFVTKSGYSIIGGASKLLKQFEKNFKPSILLSYSDNDYFSGSIYSNLGFENKGCTTSPRYYWFYRNQEIKRERCQLRHLSIQYPDLYKEAIENNASNKEDYIMLKLGALKVYRSGHTKWVKYYLDN